MDEIKKLWFQFNESSNQLVKKLGRTNNIVGEYAEFIIKQLYGGSLTKVSKSSADMIDSNGKLYQIKSRKLKTLKTAQLGIIRSWEFDYLIVVLFNNEGGILKAIEVPSEIAKEFGVENEHQHGFVISTTKEFLNHERVKDITNSLIKFN